MAAFLIGEDTADDGHLYVDEDNIATIIIRRTGWKDGAHVEICGHGCTDESAVKAVDVSPPRLSERSHATTGRQGRDRRIHDQCAG